MTDSNEEFDLEAIEASLKKYNESLSEDEARANELRAQLSELSRKVQVLTREKNLLDERKQHTRQDMRGLERQRLEAIRKQALQVEQTRLLEEFTVKSAELDELTKGLKWRDTAFGYQIEGAKKLAVAKRGILGDKRGLGKTLTSLIWLDMVQAKKVLVIAPNDVILQFIEETQHFSPHRTIFSLRGLDRASREISFTMMNMTNEYMVFVNYEAWRKDKTLIDKLINVGFDTMLMDEAHRIKDSSKLTARGTFQTAFAPNVCSKCNKPQPYLPWHREGKLQDQTFFYSARSRTDYRCIFCQEPCSNSIKNVLLATGTPILNTPEELFSLLYLVNPTTFPSESAFIADWCYTDYNNKTKFRAGALDRLTSMMSEYFLQRDRTQVGKDIPPPQITTHIITKDKVKYARQYEAEMQIKKHAQILLSSEKVKDMFFILELILRERQVMTWPAGIKLKDDKGEVIDQVDIHESQKIDVAMELIDDLLIEGERIVVFSQFKDPLYEMARRVKSVGFSAAMATGDQSDEHRTEVRRDFDLKFAGDNPKYQIVFATYKAFGTGINLNAARHMIMLDDEWNPGMQDQAIGRIDRINNDDQANVHIFRVEKSIDDFMAMILEEKASMTGSFNESMLSQKLMDYWK